MTTINNLTKHELSGNSGEFKAFKWDGDSSKANLFLGEDYGFDWFYQENTQNIIIPTSKGIVIGNIGDYIIKGANGEIFTCNSDEFRSVYVVGDLEAERHG